LKSKVLAGLVVVAATLYAVSMALPAVKPFDTEGGMVSGYGWQVFIRGFEAVVYMSPLGILWLGNPIMWIAAVGTCLGWRSIAKCAAFSAVILCVAVGVALFEALDSYPGYWCWLGSAVVLAVASCLAGQPRHAEQSLAAESR
jgi:hypothetical protein